MLKIGIAGLGTVGTEVARKIQNKQLGDGVELCAISARDKSKERNFDQKSAVWVDNPIDLAMMDELDVIVELIGGENGVSLQLVQAALKAGKHVVTANKAMLARHIISLTELAEQTQSVLNYEAAVAGGIPIIKVLKESLVANSITQISGILNGTCNFILSEMTEKGTSFDEVLKQAQNLGYAEADPSFDIEAIDAGQKLSILTALAFGVRPEFSAVDIRGITEITAKDIAFAKHFGSVIRSIGVATKTSQGIVQSVKTYLVKKTLPLAGIKGITNAVQIQADMIDEIMLQGPGAGGMATASAVLADIVDIKNESYRQVLGRNVEKLLPLQVDKHCPKVSYYIRLEVKNEIDFIARITSILAQYGVSIDEILQEQGGQGICDVAIMTHPIKLPFVEKALEELQKEHILEREFNVMPIMQ